MTTTNTNQHRQLETQSSRATLPELLRASDLAAMLSVSVRTIWRMRDAGELPQPVRLGNKLVRWQRRDIETYIHDLRFSRRA